MFGCFLFHAFSFLKRDRKGADSARRRTVGAGGVEGGENRVYCLRKNLFSIKEKKTYQGLLDLYLLYEGSFFTVCLLYVCFLPLIKVCVCLGEKTRQLKFCVTASN